MDGIKLSFEEDVLDYIVEKSVEYKLGARGLRSICEAIMIDDMFELPSTEIKEINVELEYAKAKFEKSDVKRLRAA
jgi:ATP-dependent Clp protease ATP-binding subunit ClpX